MWEVEASWLRVPPGTHTTPALETPGPLLQNVSLDRPYEKSASPPGWPSWSGSGTARTPGSSVLIDCEPLARELA